MNPESSTHRARSVQPCVAEVVSQHAEEVANLHSIRTGLLRAPDVRLSQLLNRIDARLSAHLDGLAIAGEHAWRFCDAALEQPSVGTIFTAAVRTIEERRSQRLDKLVALVEAVPATCPGLLSAFGWVGREQLQGIVASLLGAEDPFRRMTAVAACGMHRVDPALVTGRRLFDASPLVRARALRTAGEIGCRDAATACAAALSDGDSECVFWGGWSAVLLGNRGVALELLSRIGVAGGRHRQRALRLAMQAMKLGEAHQALRELAKDSANLRWLIQASGVVGDPAYVPWLMGQMANEQTARLAAEAFSLISGVDVGEAKLEGERPEDFEPGPTDDPTDPNVEMDPDDGLPWPDVAKVEKWWGANGRHFQKGTRYFMGSPVTGERCIDILKNGFQRQRILAAHYLCLLNPGTQLFNTGAPAWRQQRLLAQMQ